MYRFRDFYKRWLSWLLLASAVVCLLFPYTACAEEVSAAETAHPWENKETVLAGLMEADIADLREAIDLKLISCEELTAYYLERIETYNEEHNCFITLCDDALEIARERDAQLAADQAKGSLFGIPVVVKDNMDYAGWHTTNGHEKSDAQIAESSAEIVEYLVNEGAVILGKTNMSTDAQDAYVTRSAAVGETKNAYNTELSSGGSSGGSAVAVSLNFAAAGLGTDTNSSLRYPAALNGCVSLRSTWDALSLDGIIKLNDTRDVPGVITRTVEDQALVLDVLSGGTTQYAAKLDAEVLNGLRIGILDELTYAGYGDRAEENLDAEVESTFEKAVTELEACGAEIVHISTNDMISLCTATHTNNAASLKEKVYEKLQSIVEENQVSAVIYPTYLTAPLRSGTDAEGVYWSAYDQPYVNNCRLLSPSSGAPEISVPIGTHSLGAGIGMEICALKNEEQLLLDIAYAYTERYDHRSMPRNAENLYAYAYEGSLETLLTAYKTPETVIEEEPEAVERVTVQVSIVVVGGIPDTGKSAWIIPVVIAAAVIAAAVCIGVLMHRRKPRRQRRFRT